MDDFYKGGIRRMRRNLQKYYDVGNKILDMKEKEYSYPKIASSLGISIEEIYAFTKHVAYSQFWGNNFDVALHHCTLKEEEEFRKILEKELINPKVTLHAHWIKEDYWSEGYGTSEIFGYYYRCSNCGKTVRGGYGKCEDKFCRGCGAKMDEKENDNAID